MPRTPLVKVEGDAYSRGFQHGSRAKPLIAHNLDFYDRYYKKFLNLTWSEAVGKVSGAISKVGRYDKEMLGEIEGIAAGAEGKLEDIFVLNSRYELSITSIAERSRKGCTSFALTPEMTKSHHTLIEQNWDYRQALKKSRILLAVQQEEIPCILMHVEAGTRAGKKKG